jgi:hypothetical protein
VSITMLKELKHGEREKTFILNKFHQIKKKQFDLFIFRKLLRYHKYFCLEGFQLITIL